MAIVLQALQGLCGSSSCSIMSSVAAIVIYSKSPVRIAHVGFVYLCGNPLELYFKSKGVVHILWEICQRSDPDIADMRYSLGPQS